MATIKIDTTKMIECANSIDKLAIEYNEIINQFASRIKNMSIVTEEWIGDAAKRFSDDFEKVDMKDYNKIKNMIDEYSKLLANAANAIDKSISQNRYNG